MELSRNTFRLLGLLPEEIGPVIGIGIAYRDASGGNHVRELQKTYPTVKFGRQCPYCKSDDTYLLTGNECSIKEMEAC